MSDRPERPSAKIAAHLHAEVLKLCDDYGFTVQALYDALLEYATASIPRIDEAVSEHRAKASKAAADRRRSEAEGGTMGGHGE
jgi:hypothetical protein